METEILEFTYSAYKGLLDILKNKGYRFADYENWKDHEKSVILRHDIDTDIKKAVAFAELEKELGATSTFFILLTSDLYNVFSSGSKTGISRILECGHDIGLHFDEAVYPDIAGDAGSLADAIRCEADILGNAIGRKITTVSMHRPSKGLLEQNHQIPGIINSYGKTFFDDFKYVSDSRRHWREPIEKIIESDEYPRLHILTHAFWYNDKESDLHDSVAGFINSANSARYHCFADNFTDLDQVMSEDEVK